MDVLSTAKREIKNLSPSYFALVMATGIISTASHLQQHAVISAVLFWIANIAFALLLILFLLRLFFFFPNVKADLSSHAKGAGFLTLVAAGCILGNSYAQVHGAFAPATAFWYFGMLAWTVFIFSFLGKVVLEEREKPSPEKGLNGNWFLLVVSTQSLSILVGVLVSHLSLPAQLTIFFSLFDFMLGAMLYLLLAPIIVYRLLFYLMKPEEVTPSYWINMGAAAITTLAGLMLLQNLRISPAFAVLYPWVYGAALLFWSIASFWIPLVLIMELWRYLVKRSPLQYTSGFWSGVFPLGMYSVCTWKLAEIVQLPFLRTLSIIFLYVALLAWISSFTGMLVHLVKVGKQAGEEKLSPLAQA